MASAVTNGPPLDIPASELYLKISAAERPYKLVDFPRKDPLTGEPIGKVAIQVLLQTEILDARSEAMQVARAMIAKKMGNVASSAVSDGSDRIEGFAQILEEVAKTELIWRSCRRPDNRNLYVFPTAASVRNKLTSDECAVLTVEYSIVQSELGPIVSNMSKVEMDAWIARLVEGGSATPLAFFSPEQQIEFTMYLAREVASLRTGSSSATKPLAEPTPNEPE